ncbi:ankyrin repeat domain-containing protein 26-like isoform X2 [Mastomys coucha]|uniref:ankyrin repeat domain-containing protein 26-like isoform X2 n=1 Tax=Mastomys coucha TaxID=35658 RepID=UPI0012626D54|nr:ankyrin repeat domain-containing protein 26-like isoform X2 [Mastomys coucha]
MSFAMKKIFRAKEKTPLGFCDAPQMTVSEFFFGENPNYPKYHTTYRPLGQIHRVAAEGDAGRMEILITLGQCSVYDRDRKDRTALHFACVYGRLPVVTVLVNNNCEIDALDKNHITPLMKSVQCWKQKCATVLLKHGADPNISDSSGNSALHYAVYNGHEEMVALLLQYNADIEQKTKDGFTPLLLALREKRVEVAEFLVRMGADIHVVDDLQRNTLIYAIRCGSRDLAVLLLEKGIDFFYKDVFGWTALRYAIEGHCTFRQTLLDFEENLHSNKNDNEPELEVELNTSCIMAKQIDAGNDSLARIASCPSPETPVLTMKEAENSCDTRQSNSESEHPNCAGDSPAAVDKIFGNRGKRTVEAWVEKGPSSKSATEVRESVTNEAVERIKLLPSESETELELMSVEEDVSDESKNDQPLRIREGPPNTSGNVSVAADPRRERTNRQAAESAKEYPPLMTTNEMKDSVLDKVVPIKEAGIVQLEGPAVKFTSEEEPNSQDGFERNPPSNILKQIPAQDIGYLSITKYQRGEKMTSQEKAESSVKVTSVEDQKCPDDHEKNQRVAAFKQPQPKDIEYLSMANDKTRENSAEGQEEDSPEQQLQWKPIQPTTEEDPSPHRASAAKPGKPFLTAEPTTSISEGEQEWCDSRNMQRQGVGSLFLAEDPRYDSSIQDEEDDLPEGYVQLKPLDKEKTSLPCEALAKKEVKVFGTEPDENLSSEEKQESIDVSEEEHPTEPQQRDIAHLSMAKAERGVNATHSQEKGFPTEYPELKASIATQDYVSSEASTLNQEKSFWAGPKTEQLRTEEEHTGWRGGDKRQRKAIFERLQLKRNARVSIDPQKSEKNTRAAEDRGATAVQLRPEEDQTGWHAIDKKQQKPAFEQLQLRSGARTHMDPEESGENTEAAQEKGDTTVQLRPEEDQTGWYAIDKKQQKQIAERFQPKWNAQVSLNPEESGENTGVPEKKGAAAVQLRPEENQMGWGGSHKMQWKPILERLQLKRSARVSVGPEKSRRHRGADKGKGPTIRVSSEEYSRCHGNIKKPPRLPPLLFEGFLNMTVLLPNKEEGRVHGEGHVDKENSG